MVRKIKIQNLYYIWSLITETMKFKYPFLLVAITLCFVTKSFSQRGNVKINNGIGIVGGVTNFDITTTNFTTKQGSGFIGGLRATVDIPHKWYNMSYGMQLSESSIGISARPTAISSSQEFVDYKMFAAQVALLMHIKLIDSNFTIDLGPMLQYNGRLELKDKTKENYFINNYSNLAVKGLSDISPFNLNVTIGASAGIKFIKLKAQYIYGVTNILSKLNNQNLDTSGGNQTFKGNQSMLVFGATLTF